MILQRSDRLHMKLTKLGEPLPISDLLPMLENFGLRVISERPYELTWPEGGAAWIQDFELEHREGTKVDLTRIEARFGEALGATLAGDVENDGFNRLLLAAHREPAQERPLGAQLPCQRDNRTRDHDGAGDPERDVWVQRQAVEVDGVDGQDDGEQQRRRAERRQGQLRPSQGAPL